MKFRFLPSLISAAIFMAPAALHAAAFTPGNLAIVRVGTGAAALSNAAAAVFVDEYTTAGVFVQSIALPTAAGAGINVCTLGGTATTEGYMTLSTDGQYLVGGCYSSALGVATPSGVAPATAPRTIFRVDGSGNADTTTSIATSAASGALRGVASTSGSDLWFGTGGGGSFHSTFGSTPTVTQLYTTLNNSRNVQIANGQLYGSSASGTFRLFTIGTGLPTTTSQAVTQLNGIPTAGISPAAFYFADLSVAEAGLDTVYLTDDTSATGGIRKFSLVAGSWTLNGVIDTGSTNNRGLIGSVNAGVVTLYSTRVNTLTTVTDSAGHNAAPSSTSVTTIATAGANTALRGVAFVPAAAQPNLTIAAAQVAEGDSPGCSNTALNFTVTSSSAAPVGGINFTFSTADGSATLADNDYTQVTAGTGSIAAGATTGTASVNITCDKNAESNETFSVNLIDGATYNLGSPSTATGTINDDDTPVLSVADVSLTEGNSGTSNMTFTVQLDRPAPNGGVSYNYATADIDANSGSDYVATGTQTGSIGVGTTSQQHSVTINGDTDFEANETFSFTISAATPVAAAGNDFVATGTIQNDDVSALPTISIADVSANEGNSGTTTFSFAVTLSAPAAAGGASFDIATSDGSATDADNDYEPRTISGQSIASGNSSFTFDVTVNGDTVFESNQSFNVTITPVSGIAAVGNDLTATGTIQNDDAQPITLSIANPAALSEGNSAASTTTMTFPVTLDFPAPTGGVTFTAASSDGSATTANNDYVALPSTPFTINAGQTTPTNPVTVSIRGDLVTESDESFTVTLSMVSGSGVSIGVGTGTGIITNDDTAPVRSIAEIQGDAFASPFNASIATTFGNVVTGVLSNGFYIQDPTPDALLDTSDAMFVFTSSAPTVAVGDLVDLRGNILEAAVTVPAGAPNYSNLTKFTDSGLVVNVVNSGNPLPTPFLLDDAIPSPDPTVPFCVVAGGTFTALDFASTKNFECLEGTRVSTTQGMTNAPNQSFSGDPLAEINITTNNRRAFREAGMTAAAAAENLGLISLTPPAPALAGLVWDGNPEVFEIDIDRLGLTNVQLNPGTRFSATGILGFEFGGYELFASAFNVTQAAPPIPGQVPVAGADQLTIASLNMLRFYDRCDDPVRPNADEVVNLTQVATKLDKLSRYVREVLRSPDIIGTQESEQASTPGTVCANAEANVSALQLLSDKIVADGGPTYTVINAPFTNDLGWINVGYMVRADRINVSATAHLDPTETWVFNGATQSRLNDRPSFQIEATTLFTPVPVNFSVIVNHLRSLSGIDDLTPVADQIDAHRVRQKRLRQAVGLACEVQAYQAANPSKPLILVGDFNAFQFSDGYADTTGILRGDTNPTQSEYDIDFLPLAERCATQPNGQIVQPAISEALFALPPDQQYSFYFTGVPQVLDHAFMSEAAGQRFEGLAYGRGNADSQVANETIAGNALRTSDHDGYVLYLNAGTDTTNNAFTLFKDGLEN